MWIILFAILLLCILVFINKKREGFNASQALNIFTILTDEKTDSEEKIKKLLENIASINDTSVENIIKSEKFSNSEKIIKIKEYLDSLIDKRNAKPTHVDNQRIIDYDTFFHILKIMQSAQFDEDYEKVLEIKKLGPFDDQFDAVLNSIDMDSLRKINDKEATTPPLQNLQNLIDEIIYPS